MIRTWVKILPYFLVKKLAERRGENTDLVFKGFGDDYSLPSVSYELDESVWITISKRNMLEKKRRKLKNELDNVTRELCQYD